MLALYKQEANVLLEIIVVDNNSPEFNIADWIERHPKVQWYSNDKKRNPYTSRNMGVSKARGCYLAFIDVKCEPRTTWLSEMISSVDADHLVVAGQYDLTYRSDDIRDKVYGMLYLNNEKNVRKNYGVTAGNLLADKCVFEKIGDFKEANVSGNDIVWSLDALKSGFKIRYASDAIIDYPAQTWEELKDSVEKYASGVARINTSSRPSLTSFLPLRLSTFREHLEHRSLENLSIWRKLQLWAYTWSMKIKYSSALRKAQNSQTLLGQNYSK